MMYFFSGFFFATIGLGTPLIVHVDSEFDLKYS